MVRVICVKVSKGGVGKTTISSNLGFLLAERNNKVLLVDLDAQSNLSKGFLKYFDPSKLSSSNLVGDSSFNLKKNIYSINSNLDLIVSDIGLNEAVKFVYENDKNYAFKLKKAFSKSDFLKYDYIILDLSPGVSEVLSECAFISSNLVLCPMHFDIDSLNGIVTTINEISILSNNGFVDSSLNYLIVPNRYDKRFKSDNKVIIDMVYDNLDNEFISSPIRENSHIKKSRMRDLTAIEFENSLEFNRYGHKKAVEDFTLLADKIDKILN